MAGEHALQDGVELLERAITYALGVLHEVEPAAMSSPSPCSEWDVRALVSHLNDSVAVLHEAAETGEVVIGGGEFSSQSCPLRTLRREVVRLLGAWSRAERSGRVTIAEEPLASGLVASTGAVEVAVHGWDIARSCGLRRPIPAQLAEELLPLLPLLVTEADRPERFALPVVEPSLAGPDERMLAFLGRHPD